MNAQLDDRYSFQFKHYVRVLHLMQVVFFSSLFDVLQDSFHARLLGHVAQKLVFGLNW